MTLKIAPEVLARIPMEERNRTCICQGCARAQE
jgi:hypothetical protein